MLISLIKFFRIDKKCLFLLAVYLTCSSDVFSQTFQDIKVSQSNDTIKVSYNIIGGKINDMLKVTLSVSTDGGNSYTIFPKSVWGDVGSKVINGPDKVLFWKPLKDSVQLTGDNYVFNISGSVIGGPDNIELVSIKSGTFLMGDNFGEGKLNETDIHEVSVDSFAIGAYEITNIQFTKFLREYGNDCVTEGEFKGEPLIFESPDGLIKKLAGNTFVWEYQFGKEYNPVVGVTWYGANEFCKFYGYRLPTEAEWEYAARELGKKVRFGNGKNEAMVADINFNNIGQVSNNRSLEGNKDSSTVRVGNYAPNELGLYDMSGNAWEWCQDWYQSDYYVNSKHNCPIGPWLGEYKVIRGGSWFSPAFGIRTTVRSFLIPYGNRRDVGFRVARSI
ncbi:MAG: SUMF1/EgtB/PvdO family nonheme iron enzyme [Ignavibacteriaceae bacterium]|nr:SUMF1/EgtB/PvdO family nonheme iron enzyme [Ignavibacteriaceae bacterium]